MMSLQLIPVTTKKAVTETLYVTAGLAVFAWLISQPAPVKWIAALPLLFTGWVIGRNLCLDRNKPGEIFGFAKMSQQGQFILLGLLMGIAGSLYYRQNFSMPLLPLYFRGFVLVAVCIGIMEELVFRGFIQGRMKQVNAYLSVLIAALAHASYKACLFLSPLTAGITTLWLFFCWSAGAFVLLGLLRHFSKSIWPPLLVHAVFDLLVYAENAEAPVWVW